MSTAHSNFERIHVLVLLFSFCSELSFGHVSDCKERRPMNCRVGTFLSANLTARRLRTSPYHVTEPLSKRLLRRRARFVHPWPFRRGNRPLLGSNRGFPSPVRSSARPSAWAGRTCSRSTRIRRRSRSRKR